MTLWSNFKDSAVMASDHGLWLILALILGLFVGWAATRSAEAGNSAGD